MLTQSFGPQGGKTFAVGWSWRQAPCLSPERHSAGVVLSWDLAEPSSVLTWMLGDAQVPAEGRAGSPHPGAPPF